MAVLVKEPQQAEKKCVESCTFAPPLINCSVNSGRKCFVFGSQHFLVLTQIGAMRNPDAAALRM